MKILSSLIVLAISLSANAASTIAVVNGKPITDAEVEQAAKSDLMTVHQREYDITSMTAKSIAFDRAKTAEAARRGISVDKLVKLEVDDKAAPVSDEEVAKLVRILAPRLPKDPAEARKVVVESLRNQQIHAREEVFRDELLRSAHYELKIVPPRTDVPVAAWNPSRGVAGAPVTIVEFSDFQCPYCNRAQETLRRVEKEYEGRVRVVFRNYPLVSIHKDARMAAEASVCAMAQQKFWPLHDWMFENAANLSRDAIVAGAKTAGLDDVALAKCIDSGGGAPGVDADIAVGDEAGVHGTPMFFINGRLVSNPTFETFREVIDDELHRTLPSQPAAAAGAGTR